MTDTQNSTFKGTAMVAEQLATANDTIRLQALTIEQHERTIENLKAKLANPDREPMAETTHDENWLSHVETAGDVTASTSGNAQAVHALVMALHQQRHESSMAMVTGNWAVEAPTDSGELAEAVRRAAEDGAKAGYKVVRDGAMCVNRG